MRALMCGTIPGPPRPPSLSIEAFLSCSGASLSAAARPPARLIGSTSFCALHRPPEPGQEAVEEASPAEDLGQRPSF
jgi:hypothetical protein